MKKHVIISLVLVLLLSIGFGATAQDPTKIGLSVPSYWEDFYLLLRDGAQVAADEADIELIVPEEDAMFELESELANVRGLIAAEVDMLLFYPADPVESRAAIVEANDAGIPVLLLDRDIVRAEMEAEAAVLNIVGIVTADWEAVGADAAEFACSELGGEGIVVVLQGAGLSGEEELELTDIPAYNVVTSQVAGIQTYFEENCAGATLIVEDTETYTNADSLANLGTILEDNRANALIVGDELLTIDAIGAVRRARLRGVTFVGTERSNDVLGALEGGQLTLAIIPDPEQLGAVGVTTALAAIAGEEVDDVVISDFIRVTSETAEQYRDNVP